MTRMHIIWGKFSKRFLYSAAVVAIATSMAAAYFQSVQKADQLIVFDARGKRVGRVQSVDVVSFAGPLGVTEVPVIAFTLNGSTFTVGVLPDGFIGTGERSNGFSPGDGPVYWQSTDCSGVPFVNKLNTAGLLPQVVVAAPGNTVYIVDNPVEFELIHVQSVSPNFALSPGAPECQVREDYQQLLVPARALTNLDSTFELPLSVR